jgi:TonB-dependent starch-binding outer membrane protein SusC
MTPSLDRARHLRVLATALLAAPLFAACSSSSPRPTGSAPAPAPAPAPGTVTAEQINQSPGESIEQQIMKRSPGVWVGKTSDGGIAVRIRGGSSVMGNNEPLYIVDGSPFAPGPNGALTGLNPQDIDTIRVLKDPADLTMYGVRGANGVIVIKTKRSRSQ